MEVLQKRFKMNVLKELGVKIVAVVHDKESCYSSDKVGVDAMVKERLNSSVLRIHDPLHGIESLWGDLKKFLPEIEEIEDTMQSFFNWFSNANKRKRSARFIAAALETNFLSLKRFLETRSLAHSPAVYRSILKNVKTLELVWLQWYADNES